MGLVFDYTECLLLPGVATTLILGKFLETESELFKKLVNESNVSIFQKNTESGSNYVFSGRFADLTVANTIIVNFIDDLRTKINEVHTSLLFDSNISKIGSVINNPGSTHTQLIKEESETENMTRVTIHPLEENVHSENMESVQIKTMESVQIENTQNVQIETMESVQIENTENVQIENQGSKKRETKNELKITQQEHDKCRKKRKLTDDVQTENTENIEKENSKNIQKEHSENIQREHTQNIQIENTENIQIENTENIKRENTDNIQVEVVEDSKKIRRKKNNLWTKWRKKQLKIILIEQIREKNLKKYGTKRKMSDDMILEEMDCTETFFWCRLCQDGTFFFKNRHMFYCHMDLIHKENFELSY